MRRPIVVVDGEGATTTLVRNEGLGKCCPNDRASLCELLSDLASGVQRMRVPDAEIAARFDCRNISPQVAEILCAATETFGKPPQATV